jgi:hypothetical protein
MVRQPGNIVGAGAIAKWARLRELATSLSEIANPPRNVDEVRLRKHHTLRNVK